MKILQGGAPKCGNFWLYKILENILKKSGQDTPGFIEQQEIYSLAKRWDLNYPEQAKIDVLDVTDLQYSYRISSIYRMPVENIEDYVSKTNHVWTHSPVCKRSKELFSLFDKKIYIIRDPRDRAISAANYYCSDYMLKYFPQEIKDPEIFLSEHFEDLMYEWVWHVFDQLRLSRTWNIHIAFFEGFVLDFPQELQRLMDYLTIDLSNREKKEIEKAVSFSELKKDNPKHLNKGKTGYWKKRLTDEQVEQAAMIAGPLLREMHYPLGRNSDSAVPYLNSISEFDLLKQKIVMSQT